MGLFRLHTHRVRDGSICVLLGGTAGHLHSAAVHVGALLLRHVPRQTLHMRQMPQSTHPLAQVNTHTHTHTHTHAHTHTHTHTHTYTL